MVNKRVVLADVDETLLICGDRDANLRALEKRWGVQIFARASTLVVRGISHKVDQAVSALESLRDRIRNERSVPGASKGIVFSANVFDGKESDLEILTTATGKPVKAISENQKKYVQAMMQSDVVLSVGPAGTGKTFLAVACALKQLHAGQVRRIVLSRPVVESGEKLGYLPGDFYEKVNPYLRPLYDAFSFLLGPERFRIYREDETVEIVPLAYMRGRTLDHAFIILDEAQNTTPEQMKMFLTRMGARSKMVLSGDVTQIDLDFKKRSGFVQAIKILKDVPEIPLIEFEESDVVRHPLIRKILKAYEENAPKK